MQILAFKDVSDGVIFDLMNEHWTNDIYEIVIRKQQWCNFEIHYCAKLNNYPLYLIKTSETIVVAI